MNKKFRFYASIVLKTEIIICAAVGVLSSLGLGKGDFMSGMKALLYFTIQSNIWIAVVAAVGVVLMLSGKKPGRAWYIVKLVFTVAITLTGVVFCFVLAPTIGKEAWRPNNLLTHVFVPLSAVLDLFYEGGCEKLEKKNAVWAILPPLYYLVFASVGYVCNWDFGGGNNYPYFFMNWGSPAGAFGFCRELPFMGVVWWVILLLCFLVCCGSLYIALAKPVEYCFTKEY